MAFKSIRDEMLKKDSTKRAPRLKAGYKRLGETQPALGIAQGKLGQHGPIPNRRKSPVITMVNALRENVKHAQ